MTEATKPKAPALPPVRLVDEAYEPPKNATPIELRNGEIAAAKREGRAKEKAIQAAAFANMVARYQGEIEGVKQAHQEELARHDERWKREEAKHGSGKFWSGMATGLFVAGALVAIGGVFAVNAIIGPTFDAASRARFDAQVVSTLTQERPPTTDAPRSESAP